MPPGARGVDRLRLRCGKPTFLGRDVVSEVILAVMTERILSPDGTQFWDGAVWQPVEDPTTAGDPATAAPLAPCPAAAASPPDQQHTQQPSQQPAPFGQQSALPPPAAAVGPGDSWAVNKWAWRVALSPFVWGGAVWWVGDAGAPEWGYAAVGIVLLIGATFATDQDVRTLKKHGVAAEQSFTAAVLLLYLIGAPAYLIHRTRKARTSALIPVTWFIGVLVAVTPFLLGGSSDGLLDSTDVYVPGIESSVEDGLQDAGVRGAVVDCPEDESYDDGDMVICDVTSRSDGAFEVVLNMRNDGYFQWQAQ